MSFSEEQLLARISDPGVFEELYERHVGKVTTFATRRSSTPHEVPDLVAAVWLEVISCAGSFDPRKGHALPWILGVAANLTASTERRRAREREALDRLGRQPQLDSQAVVALEEKLDALAATRHALSVLQQLPVSERLVAELVLVEGLQPHDAAKALGI
ncbi:MAG: sigma-70 family RNA polymerase sigma factor [Actinobacteria bacterium]|nr:sigma-70 family RNA polymerase sigma factor [Actinomycetota bacterium]